MKKVEFVKSAPELKCAYPGYPAPLVGCYFSVGNTFTSSVRLTGDNPRIEAAKR